MSGWQNGNQPATAVDVVSAGVVVVTVAVGWVYSLHQMASTSGDSSGTAWLLGLAAIATLGAGMAFRARQRRHSALVACGLLLVAVSLTVFAYPLNVAVLLCALAQLWVHRGDRTHVGIGLLR